MTEKYRIFVASSSEQIKVARSIEKALKATKEWNIVVWNRLFNFSAAYIESLEKELDRADFAVVVLTGDDAANVRNKAAVLPRDNVIFELGLFIGRLGRQRCFFFIDAKSGTQIASDLSGVKPVAFYPDHEAKSQDRPNLKTQAKQVKQQIRELGPRYKPSAETRNRQLALWSFSCRIAGQWWERMRKGEDDRSAISYVSLRINDVTNTPDLEGRAYSLEGKPLAKWKSVSSTVVQAEKPIIHYRWEGEHDETHGQTFGGHGVITFDDHDSLQSGEGHYFDTNFAHVKEGEGTRVKHFGLYRCGSADVKKMEKPYSDPARALIKRRIKSLPGR